VAWLYGLWIGTADLGTFAVVWDELTGTLRISVRRSLHDRLSVCLPRRASAMAHTSGLQGRLPGCGCQGAPVGCKPFRGTKLQCRKSSSSRRVDVQTHCASTVSNVKLPATHKEASQRALDQLRASSSIVNSEFLLPASSNAVRARQPNLVPLFSILQVVFVDYHLLPVADTAIGQQFCNKCLVLNIRCAI